MTNLHPSIGTLVRKGKVVYYVSFPVYREGTREQIEAVVENRH